MELRHLRYFKTVAEEGHITRAAEKLNMQQPPLSLQIKALEQELGVQLFRRLPRGVELTESGKSFYSDTKRLLDDLDRAISKTQRIERGEQGSVTIGFTSSVIFHPSTKLSIQNFREENSEIELNLTEDGSAELVRDVAEQKLDAAFIRTNISHIDNIKTYKLADEEIMLAMPVGHPLLAFDTISASQLGEHPLILYRRSAGPGIYDSVISALNKSASSPNIIQEAPRVGAALNLVATGMGVSFVPASLCSAHSEDIRYRPIKIEPPLTASILLACRKNEGSVSVRSFIATARKTFG
ncbi:MAG: LysR family transcriptional regulator [Lentilitoribacter sp.]